MSEKTFRDSAVYPVLFMLITCIVFVGVLAVMFRTNEAKIAANKQDAYRKIVLSLLAEPISEATQIKVYHLLQSPQETYNSYIKEVSLPGLQKNCFSAVVQDSVVGYCIDISGKGLWGTIRGLVALSADCETLKGLAIYDQMETPGLGARIGEEWFLNQFRSIPLINPKGGKDNYVHALELIPEGKTAANPFQIQQVTGATITSVSVIKMLSNEINLIYSAKLKQAQL